MALVVGGVAYLRASSRDPVYEATSTVVFESNSIQQVLSGTSVPLSVFSDIPGAAMQTNLRLIRQRPVAARVKRALRSSESVGSLLGRIRTDQDGLSSLVKITASGPTPPSARNLANTWARTFRAYQTGTERIALESAVRQVRVQLRTTGGLSRSRRELLASRLEDLETLKTAQTGTVRVIEQATLPGGPVLPRKRSSTIVGLFLGLILGLASAFIRDQLDRRFHGLADIEERLGLPVLATLPAPRTRGFEPLPPAPAEAFLTLRTNVRFLGVDAHPKSFLIASPGPGEGKTTTAMYLARSLAESSLNVLLIDADLRHPDVARRARLEAGNGVSVLIAEGLSLRDCEASLELEGAPTPLRVLASGPIPPNPVDLLGSNQMRRLLEEARALNDYVIIDSPPVNLVADAVNLSELVDATLLIVRMDTTTIDQAQGAIRALERAGSRPAGLVVTGVRPRGHYGYGGYHYGARQPSQRRLARMRQSA